MNFTTTTEEVIMRSSFLVRSITLAVLFIFVMSSACTAVRRDSGLFHGKTLPGPGGAPRPRRRP